MKAKRGTNIAARITLLVAAVIIAYPLVWLLTASFKENGEIFSTLSVIPRHFTLEGYREGWKGSGQNSFAVFVRNSLVLTLPVVAMTILSSCLVAYGFSRFDFPRKKLLFALMISTMMLPNTIIMIPRYILFMKFGWLNSYKPFYALALFAANPFFTFLLVQFFRGIPKQLDESAYLDGCSRSLILRKIILPLAKTPIVSVGLFQFMWTWNDFSNVLIYIDRVKLYPVSLGLRLAIDAEAAISWNKVIAMTIVSMVPCVVLFLSMQKYFVEGIAKTGLKG